MAGTARLTSKQKIKIIRQVLRERRSVASVCRQWGITRPTYYRWLKKYQKVQPQERLSALSKKQLRDENHYRRLSAKKEQRVLAVASQKPELSVHQLATFFKDIGHHGIQNILERYNLSRHEQRLEFSQQFKKKKERGVEEKLRAIGEYQAGKSVSRVCLEFNISRPTFYRWYREYQKNPSQADSLLKSKRLLGEAHWKAVNPEVEKKILRLVLKHPEYSTHRIAQKIREVSNHGVQNVFSRNNLNTQELRLAWAQTAELPIARPLGILGEIKQFIGQIPTISAIPPPLSGIKLKFSSLFQPFFISFLISTAIFNFSAYWLRAINQAPALGVNWA